MEKFTDINECLDFIQKIKRFKDKMSLDKLLLASEKLGNPHLSFKTIHIAGTNGKGSTLNMLKSILLDKGLKIGTYISPYVTVFNERITLNNQYISDEDILKYTNMVMPLYYEFLEKYEDNLTFFEIVTLMSFLYFRDQDVDYVLYEVGLGGLLDATNIIKPVLTIITNIGYDHMNVLGNTLEEIAIQKLGIVKKDIPLVTGIEETNLKTLFKDYVKDYNSDLYFVEHDLITNVELDLLSTTFSYKNYQDIKTSLIGYHQAKNAALVIEGIKALNKYSNLAITDTNIYNGLSKVFWPGRMEVIKKEPLVILDGAHNIHGINALVKSLEKFKDNYHIKCIFSCLADKETLKMITSLETVVDEIYFSSFDYIRAQDSNQMLELAHIKEKYSNDDYKALVFDVLNKSKKEDLVIITGSLYFISTVRKLFI